MNPRVTFPKAVSIGTTVAVNWANRVGKRHRTGYSPVSKTVSTQLLETNG